VMFIVIFVLTVVLMTTMLFAVFMRVASLYIGAIFGRLIIPWLAWKPLVNMTERWVSFMISNGIAFCVAITIVNALGKALAGIVSRVLSAANQSVSGGIGEYVISMVGIFAVYLFVINLLSQANNIAQGMTGGTAIGEGLFGKIAAMAAGAAVGKMAAATGAGHLGAAKAAAWKGVGAAAVGKTNTVKGIASDFKRKKK